MAFLPSVTGLQVVGLFFAYVATTVIYRRFFHPLAKIPGPFLACVTSLYGFYFNGVKGGVFYLEIERLHRIYGMSFFFFWDTQVFLLPLEDGVCCRSLKIQSCVAPVAAFPLPR
jgi:hypothetical protein